MSRKVLHLIKTLKLGGAETNLLNLVKATDKTRFGLHIAYSYGGELESQFQKSGAKLYKFSNTEDKIKSLKSLVIIAHLAKYIRKNKIDIIHTHSLNTHIWGSVAAKFTGVKIVEHVHDFRYFDPVDFVRRRGFNNQYKFVKYLKGVSDRIVVLTKQNKEFLLKNNISTDAKVCEILNGISFDVKKEFPSEQIRQKFNIPANAQVIFTPVRFSPEKNVDLIFNIASKVCETNPNAIFVIAGNGPLFDSFKARVKEEKLENCIKLVGFQPDIHELLAISYIFLLPSFLELHSIAILEAMSMKVSVVASKDVGCNREFIKDWENGVLLDPFSTDGWAQAIIKLLKDKSLCATIGGNGYLTCRDKFDIKQTARAFEELYETLS